MLEKFRAENRTAFIPFLVAGDPDLDVTRKMIDVLIEEGANALEIGVPFSDAAADGPVIQAASERASKTTSLTKILEFVSSVHDRHPKIPLILFTYYNPIFKMGIPHFAKKAYQAGVSGVLVVDLPPEESEEYCKTLDQTSLQTIFLASPTTSEERLRLIESYSTGFIYYVSRTGVTGEQKELSDSLNSEIAQVRKITQKPLAIGFGISTTEHARQVAQLGDAVVVGSAFVRLIADNKDHILMEKKVRELAREITRGCSKQIAEITS